jgi:hypothetical protein
LKHLSPLLLLITGVQFEVHESIEFVSLVLPVQTGTTIREVLKPPTHRYRGDNTLDRTTFPNKTNTVEVPKVNREKTD